MVRHTVLRELRPAPAQPIRKYLQSIKGRLMKTKTLAYLCGSLLFVSGATFAEDAAAPADGHLGARKEHRQEQRGENEAHKQKQHAENKDFHAGLKKERQEYKAAHGGRVSPE